MNPCCSGFSCDLKNVTKSDLDRFTDKIENVLSDEKGRKLFRNYMITCNMKHGLQTLNFWEKIDKEHHRRRDSDDTNCQNPDIDRLIDDAERIEYLDYGVVKNLVDAHEEKNNEKLKDALNILKVESTEALRKEYDKFKSFYTR